MNIQVPGRLVNDVYWPNSCFQETGSENLYRGAMRVFFWQWKKASEADCLSILWPHKEVYATQGTYNVVYILPRKAETPRDPFWVAYCPKHNGMLYYFQEVG